MRKPWKWLLAGNALLVLGLLCLTWNYRGNRITKENAARIKPGMKLAEVEAILGPPRNELEGRAVVLDPPRSWRAEPVKYRDWVGKSLAVLITFDPESDCVVYVHLETPYIFDLSWSDKLEEYYKLWFRK